MKIPSFLLLFLLFTALGQELFAQLPLDTAIQLNTVVVGGKMAVSAPYASIRTVDSEQLTAAHIESIKEVSLSIPNLYMPDYGSRMTSAIYVRGLGARMDQPVMGLLVDGIPILNKNNFDTKYVDLVGITVARGSQSTLFGRNTIGGLISVRTLSPRSFQGLKAQVNVANGETLGAALSLYRKLNPTTFLSVGGYGERSNGLYTNTYNGSSCDVYQEAGGRFRLEKSLKEGLDWVENLTIGWVDQQGYPYRQWINGTVNPIQYNDPSGYKRFSLNQGFTVKKHVADRIWSSVSSYQYTKDAMTLDQDFTVDSIFTIQQCQNEHVVSEDFTLQTGDDRSLWRTINGLNLFFRHLTTNAPVTFKRQGIEELILANANEGLQTAFPGESLLISDETLLLSSSFSQPTLGFALYHQSALTLGNWSFHAGLRLDLEGARFTYSSATELHYRFTMTMPDYKRLASSLDGIASVEFVELLPSLAATWHPASSVHLSASLTKGFKAGGFNTQLFSDILKNTLMNDLMGDLGVYLSTNTTNYDVSQVVTYKPEYSWNYELKAEVSPFKGMHAVLTGFYIDCRDQQLTVFPDGQQTGRMMTNAGRTRSTGFEAEASYRNRLYAFQVDYGHTDAHFLEYNNGLTDYSGKRVPFAPEHTLHASVDRYISCKGALVETIDLHLGYSGCGRIWWTEANDVSQPYYQTLDASVGFTKGRISLQCWGKNLTNTDFNTFYFVSMGNAFLQKGKPVQVGLSLRYTLSQ